MRRLFIAIAAAVSVLAGATTTEAASVSLVPDSVTSAVGEEFTLTVRLDFTDAPTIGGGYDIIWNTDKLQLVSWNPVNIGDPAFFAFGTIDTVNGTITGACQGDFNALNTPANVGTITFLSLEEVLIASVGTQSNASPCGHWIGTDFAPIPGVSHQSTVVTINEAPPLIGDINEDGVVDENDIDPFCAILDAGGYTVAADWNEDGAVTAQDIAPFCQFLYGDSDCAICTNRPLNDDCFAATPIECNTTIIADNSNATTDPGDPDFTCRAGTPDQGAGSIWYSFVATDTTVLIETCATPSGTPADDSLLALYAGSCGPFVEYECAEDNCSNGSTSFLSSICAVGLTIGETYYIQLASYSSSDQGPYTLSVQCPCPSAVCDEDSVDGDGLAQDTSDYWIVDSATFPGSPVVAAHPFNVATGSPLTDLDLWLAMYCLASGGGCNELPSHLEIAFAEDNAGLPGRVICSYSLSSDMVPSFDNLNNLKLSFDLLDVGAACDLTSGWLLIQGYGGTEECQLTVRTPLNPGGQLLIDPASGYGIPSEETSLAYCLGSDDTLGACCLELEPCVLTTHAGCDARGGTFQGVDVPCESVPCGETYMLEPFLYASDVALENVWDGVQPAGYGLRSAIGNPNNSYEITDTSTTADRLLFEIDDVPNTSSGYPVVVEFDLYLDPAGQATNWDGANHWVEFGSHSGGSFGAGTIQKYLRIGLVDDLVFPAASDPQDNQWYQLVAWSPFVADHFIYNLDNPAPPRSPGWTHFRCEIGGGAKVFVNGVFAINLVSSGSAGPIDWIRLGSGLPTNGHYARIDNVRVAQVPQTTAPAGCPADIAGSGNMGSPDGTVDLFDLLKLLDNWNAHAPGAAIAPAIDTVDLFDLLALIDAWGDCD